jgi:hypothetical protein
MKKIIFAIVLLTGIGSVTNAQDFKTGIRLGIGESELNDRSGEETNLLKKLSFSGGISASYDFNEWFGLLGDVLLVNNGGRVTGQDDPNGIFGPEESFTNTYNFTYLEVPILASGRLKNGKFGLRAFVGPSINFMLKAAYQKQYDDSNADEDHGFRDETFTNKVDGTHVAVIAGMGLDIDISDRGVFFVDFRMGDFTDNLIDAIPGTGGNRYSLNYYRISFGTRYTL